MSRILFFPIFFLTIRLMAQVPAITSFSPLFGEVGTTVTIKGTNFSPVLSENIVFFGSIKANVVSAKSTDLQVSSPAGSTFQPISVTVKGLTSYSNQPFVTTFFSTGINIDDNTFGNNVDYTTGKYPSRLSVADINGDDLSDIVVVNSGDTIRPDSTFSVFLNRSTTGNFTTTSLATRVNFASGILPISITNGDLNGDGKQDIVVGNGGFSSNYSTEICVFINRSKTDSVKFDTRKKLICGKRPISVLVRDLDEDGKPEIIVANREETFISVFRNTTSGDTLRFATRIDIPLQGNPNGLAVGDLNQDGKLEIIVTEVNKNNLVIIYNLSGLGTLLFSPQTKRFSTPQNPIDIVLADFDGDGKLDVSACNIDFDLNKPPLRGNGRVSVFRNVSTVAGFNFETRIDLEGGQLPFVLVSGDVNGDGKPDLIVSNKGDGSIVIFQNQCVSGKISKDLFKRQGGYTAGSFPEGLALVDLNRDSKPDLVVANAGGQDAPGNTFSILQNAIPLRIPVITAFAPSSGRIGTTVTISGGIFSENVVENFVYFGATRAKIISASAAQLVVSVPPGATLQPISVTTGGRTGFSDKPFLVTYPSSSRIDENSFSKSINLPVKSLGTGVAVGDLNNDGKTDIISVNSGSESKPDSTISILRNISKKDTIAFATYKIFLSGKDPRNIAVADLNGDGKLDVVVSNKAEGTISVFKNISKGDSIFLGKRIVLKVGNDPFDIKIGDLDNDGRPDLIVPNFSNNNVSVLRNQSNPDSLIFSAKVDFAVGSNPISAAISDLDGDGKLEIIIVNFFSNNISVLYNQTAAGSIVPSSFASQVNFAVGGLPRPVAVTDMNGDGKPDIVVGNVTNANVSVLQNQASKGSINSSSFTFRINFKSGNPFGLTIADLDGDTKPEMIILNSYFNNFGIYQNQYTTGSINLTTFAAAVNFTAVNNPNGVTVADLDGDEKPDIVVANNGGAAGIPSSVSVLRNLVLPPAPVINSYTPFTDIGPGGSLTLLGNNFLEIQDITFGGVSQKTFTLVSANRIDLKVPPKAKNGYLVLKTRGGKDSVQFIAMDAPNLISGSSILCLGDTSVVFSIPPINGATSYSWILPPGMTVTSKPDSSVIRVKLGQSIAGNEVRVRGINNNISGRESPVFIFRTSVLVNTPSNLTAEPVSTRQISLKWNYGQSAKGFVIERSRNGDANFSLLVNVINPSGTITTSYQDQSVEINSTYFYRLKAYTEDCSSAFSNKIGAATPTDEIVTALNTLEDKDLSISPNPTNGLLSIVFFHQFTEKVTIRLTNLLGQTVKSAEIKTGNLHHDLNIQEQTNGVYLLILENKDLRIVRKIIKQ